METGLDPALRRLACLLCPFSTPRDRGSLSACLALRCKSAFTHPSPAAPAAPSRNIIFERASLSLSLSSLRRGEMTLSSLSLSWARADLSLIYGGCAARSRSRMYGEKTYLFASRCDDFSFFLSFCSAHARRREGGGEGKNEITLTFTSLLTQQTDGRTDALSVCTYRGLHWQILVAAAGG